MGDPEHQVVLTFKRSCNEITVVYCVCGEACGEVKTGTSIPEILSLYREHTTA